MSKRWFTYFLVAILSFCFACGKGRKDSISVVTFNMYVGFDAEEKFAEFEGGGNLEEIALGILNDFQANQPDLRMQIAGAELARLSPDFICLQEVTEFTVLPFFSVDYLELIIQAIKDSGGPQYEYITSENIFLSKSVSLSGIPIVFRFKDREALLYKKGFEPTGDMIAQKLSTYRDPVEFEGEQIVFYRSILGGRFKYGSDRLITLFTTHLDQENLGSVQSDQISEILSIISPFTDDQNLVLVGDFNSEEGEETYGLIEAGGYSDTYRALNTDEGLTCCSLDDLSNLESVADQKIDLIFYRSSLWDARESEVILNFRNPIWPSDHFGVRTVFTRIEPDLN